MKLWERSWNMQPLTCRKESYSTNPSHRKIMTNGAKAVNSKKIRRNLLLAQENYWYDNRVTQIKFFSFV